MDAREYFTAKRRFWPDVCKAYDSLADEYELLCLEGAGSPGEINLKSADVVNMNMARYARARVLLAGDIDRGGVYASFLGTWMTFAPWEKNCWRGSWSTNFEEIRICWPRRTATCGTVRASLCWASSR